MTPFRWTGGLQTSALSWSLAVSVIAQASTFAMGFVLARILGRVAFGEWAAIQSTVGTISGIAQLSMAVTATKFVAEFSRTNRARAGRILALCSTVTLATGVLSAAAVAIYAPRFSESVLRAPHLVTGVRISAVSMLLLTINGYQVGAVAGLERFRALALLGAAQGIATALLVTVFALVMGLEGALLGYALAAGATWALFRFALRGECRRAGIEVRYAHMRQEMSVLAHFAFPATLAGIAGMVAGWVSALIVIRLPGGFAEMAALSAAGTIRGAVLFAPKVVTRVSAPVLASLVGTGAMERHNTALKNSTWLAGLSATAVALPVIATSPWLIELFGKSFQGSAPVVVLMAVGGVFEATGDALNQEFLSRGRMWWNLALVTGRGVILVAATSILVPAGGAVGAAWAALLAYGVAFAFVIAFIAWTRAPEASRRRQAE